ncbi:condensin-2 complex subunit D3-like [Lingula anatina]|uniref:Condensin-2 complex subunit D3-like n=1 Tax=Lingula anatina TaxID=7574 RepID=A0A1S3KEY1_LINAN|nr:condensin-2 complex subunit D3-like [Lingula anatina]|eukprot:XP_013421009.1 condensin-2 complex subunit D3-like [Lingula anatina]
MADVGKTVECLSTLDFTGLDTDWVKEVWERDFTDYDPLPISTEEGLEGSGYHVETLKLTRKILQPWALGEEGKSGEGFWTVLVENDLPHRNFVSFLYYIIEAGSKRVANAQLREAAISAADVYFTLICIPGSGAFKIFHPMLFQKSVDVFKSWTQLGSPKRKRKPSPVRSSQAGRRGKARKTTKEPEQDVAGDDFGEREDEDEDEDEDILTPQEISKLRSCLLSLLRNFTTLLKNYSLKESESSAQHALQILVELSKQEAETVGEDFDLTSDVNRVHSISKLAFMGMDCLCSASHGDINVMITTAFKYLLPSILMLIGDGKGVAAQAIPRDIQTIKDNALAFVCHLLRTKPEAAAASARILLQHMCTKVPDRAEYRAKVAQAVVTLLQELPNSAYARMMEWIYRYSRHAKISYRVFALEIVTLLLSEPERKQDDSVHADHAVYLSQSFLIQMVLARCSDVNSSVRSRAIAGFSQCVASKDSAIGLTIKEMFTPRNGPLGRVPISRVVPTPETQRTAPASEGQGSEGHTPQETETSSDKTIDETSDKTVATEGQALEGPPAAATVDPKESTPLPVAALAVQLTPGAEFSLADGKGVVSMLRRRACDEKVNVRKAALQALENVVRMEGDAFNKQVRSSVVCQEAPAFDTALRNKN